MMGSTHAVSGQAVWLAGSAVAVTAGFHPHPMIVIGGTVLARWAAYLPDLDHEGSTAARSLGPVSRIMSWVLARTCGHRRGTHTAVATALVGVGAALVGTLIGRATTALVGPAHGWWVGIAVAAGYAVAVAGDMLTIHGCPIWLPMSDIDRHLLPGPLLMRTGRAPELLVIAPALWALSAVCGGYWLASLVGMMPPQEVWLPFTVVVGAASVADGWRRWVRCTRRREHEQARRASGHQAATGSTARRTRDAAPSRNKI
jgi:membrane-bound metal-dependent hydrolase YbcI (DUF457 family)